MEIEAASPSATLKLPDKNVSLWRGCTLRGAPQQFRTGDRMIIDHITGLRDDVWIVGTGAQLAVKRLAPSGELLGKSGYDFADLDVENQKRLLTIYEMFDAK